MAITLRRQLNDDEKQSVLNNHGRKCFATGHLIPDGQVVQFDHIRAFTSGGVTELNNIAPMCETHNKAKGTLPLEDFRVRLRLQDFFAHGDAVTLKHLLAYMKKSGDIAGYGQSVIVNESEDNHTVKLDAGNSTYSYDLYKCPTTGWKYFYATLPVALFDSDDDEGHTVGLQPRFLIFDKVFELYRHFQRHPVLQPSIGRVSNDRVLFFDGQHKVAALLWTGRREFECKIYLAPDIRLLNETNIAAHDKFSQTRFYASIMVLKLGTEFGLDFERYKNLEDDATKSEAGFVRFLEREQALTKGERNKRFRSYLYNSVLEHKDNALARYVVTGAKPRAWMHFLLAPARLGAILCECATTPRPFRAKPPRA